MAMASDRIENIAEEGSSRTSEMTGTFIQFSEPSENGEVFCWSVLECWVESGRENMQMKW